MLHYSVECMSVGDETLCWHRTSEFQLLVNFILLNFLNFIFSSGLKVHEVQHDNKLHCIHNSLNPPTQYTQSWWKIRCRRRCCWNKSVHVRLELARRTGLPGWRCCVWRWTASTSPRCVAAASPAAVSPIHSRPRSAADCSADIPRCPAGDSPSLETPSSSINQSINQSTNQSIYQ